jgi:preprotein translocase subunit SecG
MTIRKKVIPRTLGRTEMQTLLIVVHLMIVSAMIGVVLLQRSEGGGLGIGSTGGFLTSRGTANVLTRTTAILAGLFFATSLALSILAGIERKPHSILQGPPGQSGPVAPPTSGSPLDSVGGPQAPASPPPAPSGPQVPQSR